MARRTRTTRTTARPKATISRGKKRRFTAKQKKAIAAAIGTLAAAGVGVAAAKSYFKAAVPSTDAQAVSVQASSGIRDDTSIANLNEAIASLNDQPGPRVAKTPTSRASNRRTRRSSRRAVGKNTRNNTLAQKKEKGLRDLEAAITKDNEIAAATRTIQKSYRKWRNTGKPLTVQANSAISDGAPISFDDVDDQSGSGVANAPMSRGRIEELEKRLREAYHKKNICSTQKINNKSKTQKRARNRKMKRIEKEIETITSLLKVLKK